MRARLGYESFVDSLIQNQCRNGSGSTRPGTNSVPESTRPRVNLAGSTRPVFFCFFFSFFFFPQRTAARWTCRRWRNTSSVGEMLDELEWPSLESRRERSSLTFFYKIHSGTVSLDKDKYLTPAPNLRHTRASHESQYTRPFAYSDALKNSFFPRTIPVWNSLPSSVVLSKTIEEFKASI